MVREMGHRTLKFLINIEKLKKYPEIIKLLNFIKNEYLISLQPLLKTPFSAI